MFRKFSFETRTIEVEVQEWKHKTWCNTFFQCTNQTIRVEMQLKKLKLMIN